MERSTIRLTMAQALVRWLTVQFTEIDGQRVPLFAGVFGIFGHGNVTCLSEALEAVQDQLPTWRGQNEQSMALAAIGFAKAKRRRQIMIATSSIGPGALNMVTAAGTAHANRLPVLLIAGDTEEAVRLEILAREGAGSRLIGSPGRVGSRWFATVSKPGDAAAPALSASGAAEPPRCSIERIGLQVIVRGKTEAAVCDAIANLTVDEVHAF